MLFVSNDRGTAMKKRRMLTLFLIITLILYLSSCINTNNNLEKVQNIYVSLRHNTNDNIQCLKWIVENRSNKDTEAVTFNNGDILNYEIRNHASGIKYKDGNKDNTDITLKPGEKYETTVEFIDMPIGHYDALFWAEWAKDKKMTMKINFDVQ